MADFLTTDTPSDDVREQSGEVEDEGQRMIELKHSEPGIRQNPFNHQFN